MKPIPLVSPAGALMPGPPADDTSAARHLALAAGVVAMLVCLLMAYWLWVLRDHRLQAGSRQVMLQTSAVAEHARVIFDAVDASLLGTVADLRSGRLDPAAAHASLSLRVASQPSLRALSLADPAGRVIASSWSDPPPGIHATPHGPDLAALRIHGPVANGYDGREAIVLSRAVPDAASPVAQVIAVVDNRFVAAFFARVAIAPDAQVGLYTREGARLAGDLNLAALADDKAHGETNAAVLRHLLAATHEGITEQGPAFVAAEALDGMPLIVVTQRTRALVLAPWIDYVVGATLTSLIALVLLALIVKRLRSEMSARVLAQAALERSREHTRLAFDAAQEGTWSWEPARAALDLSPRMAALLGIGEAQVPQDFLRGEHIHPDDREAIEHAALAHVEGRSAQLVTQFRVAAPGGGWRWVHARGRAARDAEGRVRSIVGTASDETEARARGEQLQELQTRLQRTRRLESLGRLAGGIAHDFNNILASILGYADLLQQALPSGSTPARHAEQVLRAGERGKSLVARILAFSHGGARPHVALDVAAAAGEALALVEATAPPTIRLERDLQTPGTVVCGDATQLVDAITNLCTNALAAMPQGGTLRVQVQAITTDSTRTLSHGVLPSGRHVCIAVSDEGVGIAAAAMEHLFEPFFTTRAAEGGTGLGLAMVHGAVKEMKGVIDVASTPGHGTCFSLYFPRVDATPAEPPAFGHEAVPHGHGEVIMVVDDEPALVTLTEEVLAALGYEPVGFADPVLALEELRASPDRFDALLTDQLMPTMAGTALARALRGLRPDMPILLASGFGGADLARQARDAGVSVVLQKPLHRVELARQLASFFDPA